MFSTWNCKKRSRPRAVLTVHEVQRLLAAMEGKTALMEDARKRRNEAYVVYAAMERTAADGDFSTAPEAGHDRLGHEPVALFAGVHAVVQHKACMRGACGNGITPMLVNQGDGTGLLLRNMP